MRILVCGDVHFSQYSSIMRKRGQYYSDRLENCIKSIIWAEQTAVQQQCEMIVYLGDFFDRADLNSEELTAIGEINWQPTIRRVFLVGNHEAGLGDLSYNSTSILSLVPNSAIIDKPFEIGTFGARLYFLPYITEESRKPLKKYLAETLSGMMETQEVKHNIVFSHNDIKGIQYGCFESKEGFDLQEIEASCDLFINGHLHNGSYLNDRRTILNLGNLTGQNFSEDACIYRHEVAILDTDTLHISTIENPCAYNFYKFEVNDSNDLNKIKQIIKNNAVLSLKCRERIIPELRQLLNEDSRVAEYRIISVPELEKITKDTIQELTAVDHIKAFKSYILSEIGSTDVILKELQELN